MHIAMARRETRSTRIPLPQRLGVGPVVLLITICVASFANSLTVPFFYDDLPTIVENASIRSWSDWRSIVATPTDLPISRRPLVGLSLALNYSMAGLDVWLYHAWNLVVHVSAALVGMGVIRRTLLRFPLSAPYGRASEFAFAVALVWAIHPLNSEVVNYVTQRTESMMALFYLLTLYASIRALEQRQRWRWSTLAVTACALGMLCKESMATAPLMVVLYDRTFIFDKLSTAWRQRLSLYGGLCATWFLLALTIATSSPFASSGFTAGVNSWTYLLNQAGMIIEYLRLAVWPRELVAYYGWPAALSVSDVWAEGITVVALLVLTVVAMRRCPTVGFLGAWFFITLAPTSSIIPIATEVAAARRMYLPMWAVLTLAAAGVLATWRAAAGGRRAAVAVPFLAFGALTATLVTATVQRNAEYHSTLRLAQLDLERWPSPFSHASVADQLFLAGQHEEAKRHYMAAVPGAPRAHYAFGLLLLRQGAIDDAIVQWEAFCRAQPLDFRVPDARLRLARAYETQQRWARALEQARIVMAMFKSDTAEAIDARGIVADVSIKEGKFSEATTTYREYLKWRPNDGGAWMNLGVALANTGDGPGAVDAFRRTVTLSPANAAAYRNLALALFEIDSYQEAVNAGSKALALQPNDPDLHVMIGRALANQQQFAAARNEFQRALALAPDHEQARLLLRQLQRLTP